MNHETVSAAPSGADCEMSVESLAQFRLEQLARRGMRESVDEHDINPRAATSPAFRRGI